MEKPRNIFIIEYCLNKYIHKSWTILTQKNWYHTVPWPQWPCLCERNIKSLQAFLKFDGKISKLICLYERHNTAHNRLFTRNGQFTRDMRTHIDDRCRISSARDLTTLPRDIRSRRQPVFRQSTLNVAYTTSGGGWDNGCQTDYLDTTCLEGENIALCIVISQPFSNCDLRRDSKQLVI